MRAEQHVAIRPPGFVWNASIRVAPGLALRVRDEYSGGEAVMRGALAGLVPILNRRNTPGLAEGALLRYLAEAPVVPTALLPSAGVEWSAIDDRSARATLADAGLTVSMDVHFGPGGEITGGTAHRYRDVGSTGVLTPFEGRVADYRRVDRMMVPMHSEATWSLPEGPYTFWRSRVSRLQYEY